VGGGAGEEEPGDGGEQKTGLTEEFKAADLVVDADAPDLKGKFGVTETGKDGVTKTFEVLSEFINAGGLTADPPVIAPGDYIDLDGGLTVNAYEGGGGFSYSAEDAQKPITVKGADRGKILRLIVVGINSFHSGKGHNGTYTVEANDEVPHVVFQFQNIPVKRAWGGNVTGGYAQSDVRKYLTGNFLDGLKHAGVPEGLLWGPERYVSTKGNGAGKINDFLWLPTEREMFADGKGTNGNSFSVTEETAANQARLEYYTGNATRQKFEPDGLEPLFGYWEASASRKNADILIGTLPAVCIVYSGNGNPDYILPYFSAGIAPAFCIK
jgi:hypothetical protein